MFLEAEKPASQREAEGASPAWPNGSDGDRTEERAAPLTSKDFCDLHGQSHCELGHIKREFNK